MAKIVTVREALARFAHPGWEVSKNVDSQVATYDGLTYLGVLVYDTTHDDWNVTIVSLTDGRVIYFNTFSGPLAAITAVEDF